MLSLSTNVTPTPTGDDFCCKGWVVCQQVAAVVHDRHDDGHAAAGGAEVGGHHQHVVDAAAVAAGSTVGTEVAGQDDLGERWEVKCV